jgi:hypothetical protein
MTPEQLFSYCHLLALAGWILLIAAPRRVRAMTIAGTVVPGVLSCLYLFLLAFHAAETRGGFSSLAAVFRAVLPPVAPSRRLGALPRLRSVRRHVGNPRRRRARHPAVDRHAVSALDVSLRTDRMARLSGGATDARASVVHVRHSHFPERGNPCHSSPLRVFGCGRGPISPPSSSRRCESSGRLGGPTATSGSRCCAIAATHSGPAPVGLPRAR